MIENNPLNDYIPIAIFLAVILGFAAFILISSRLLGRGVDHKDKMKPYECGVEPKHSSRRRFGLGFYLTAVLFLLFDIEVVFLFPWAINLCGLGTAGFVLMSVFIFVLGLGLIYAWRKGALEWD